MGLDRIVYDNKMDLLAYLHFGDVLIVIVHLKHVSEQLLHEVWLGDIGDRIVEHEKRYRNFKHRAIYIFRPTDLETSDDLIVAIKKVMADNKEYERNHFVFTFITCPKCGSLAGVGDYIPEFNMLSRMSEDSCGFCLEI